jgi:hypothetical protein
MSAYDTFGAAAHTHALKVVLEGVQVADLPPRVTLAGRGALGR